MPSLPSHAPAQARTCCATNARSCGESCSMFTPTTVRPRPRYLRASWERCGKATRQGPHLPRAGRGRVGSAAVQGGPRGRAPTCARHPAQHGAAPGQELPPHGTTVPAGCRAVACSAAPMARRMRPSPAQQPSSLRPSHCQQVGGPTLDGHARWPAARSSPPALARPPLPHQVAQNSSTIGPLWLGMAVGSPLIKVSPAAVQGREARRFGVEGWGLAGSQLGCGRGRSACLGASPLAQPRVLAAAAAGLQARARVSWTHVSRGRACRPAP